MEKEQIVPQDILDDANRLYPKSEWNGIYNPINERYAYIKGRKDERAKQQLPVSESVEEAAKNNYIRRSFHSNFPRCEQSSVEGFCDGTIWANQQTVPAESVEVPELSDYDKRNHPVRQTFTTGEGKIGFDSGHREGAKYGATWANQQAVSPTGYSKEDMEAAFNKSIIGFPVSRAYDYKSFDNWLSQYKPSKTK